MSMFLIIRVNLILLDLFRVIIAYHLNEGPKAYYPITALTQTHECQKLQKFYRK